MQEMQEKAEMILVVLCSLQWRKSHIRIWMVTNIRINMACCHTQNQNEHRPSRTLSANVSLNDKDND